MLLLYYYKCTANLAVTSPCEAVTGGGVAGVAITDYDIKGVATDASDALYFVSLSATVADLYTLYKFDPSSGTITTITDSNTWDILATSWTSYTSVTVQISSSGVIFIMRTQLNVCASPGSDSSLHWFDPSTSTSSSYTNSGWIQGYPSYPSITNTFSKSFALDSEDRVWIMLVTHDANFCVTSVSINTNSTVDIYKFDSLTPSASMTLKFSTTMRSYATSFGYSTSSSTTLNDFSLSFDASGNLWALWWTTDKCTGGGTATCEYTATLNKIGASSSTPAASVVLVDGAISSDLTISYASGAYVLRTSRALEKYASSAALVSTHTVPDTSSATSFATDSSGNIWFANPAGSSSINKLVSGGTAAAISLKSYAGGASEWFVCGSTKQDTVPGSVEELNTACALNGVKWSANTAGGDTFFSDEEYAALASTCDSTLYTRICDVVAELPPYICTKEEPSSMIVYLGVAAANSELLYVSLIFFCGFVFDAISRWNHANEEGNGDGDCEAGAKEPAMDAGEVEMAPAVSSVLKASPLLTVSNNAALEKKVATMEKDAVATKKEVATMEKDAVATKKKVDLMEKEMAALKMQLATLLSNQGSQL